METGHIVVPASHRARTSTEIILENRMEKASQLPWILAATNSPRLLPAVLLFAFGDELFVPLQLCFFDFPTASVQLVGDVQSEANNRNSSFDTQQK